MKQSLPFAAGIGMRQAHHTDIMNEKPGIAWLEVHSENFMCGGSARVFLEKIREHYPISLHSVGLSLGSADGVDQDHLDRLVMLANSITPSLVSDHLSWSVNASHYFNDLLPLPYTKEALDVFCRNVDHAQNSLKRQILIENPSTYLQFDMADYSETDFIREICKKTGCGLLLDINNIIVSAFNHEFEAQKYVDALADMPVGEYHLAGHHTKIIGNRGIKIDDHGSVVPDSVWALFQYAVGKIGPRPALVEWDSTLPALSELLAEADTAQEILNAA